MNGEYVFDKLIIANKFIDFFLIIELVEKTVGIKDQTLKATHRIHV